MACQLLMGYLMPKLDSFVKVWLQSWLYIFYYPFLFNLTCYLTIIQMAGEGYRMHRLHLCRGVKLLQRDTQSAWTVEYTSCISAEGSRLLQREAQPAWAVEYTGCISAEGSRLLQREAQPAWAVEYTGLHLGRGARLPLMRGSVSWDRRIHRLHFCRGVIPPPHNDCPTKQSDGETQVKLELWGVRSTPSLPLLPGPLWPRVVAPDKVLSMDQIELFDI